MDHGTEPEGGSKMGGTKDQDGTRRGGGGVKGIEYICSTAGCLRCYSQIEDNLQIYAVAEAVCLGAPYIVCRAGLTTIL